MKGMVAGDNLNQDKFTELKEMDGRDDWEDADARVSGEDVMSYVMVYSMGLWT